MLNQLPRTWLASGVWFVAIMAVAAWSATAGAKASTVGFLVLISIAPPIVMRLVAGSPPGQSVADVLHSNDAKDGR